MYSFYGGRPGNSFIIVTTYRSVKDMVDNFKKGPGYTVVHYDEYVMINAVNKNDPDNGKLYRRGYEFTNKMGGAEYIGTIVGPSGKAPLLEMTTIAEVEKKQRSEGFEERRSSGEYKKENMTLIPGKTANGDYNDSITWACCSIRNSDSEDTTAYIGFTFPYTVIDFESSTVEPYKSGNYSDTSSVTRQDDGEHPFYEKWHINIPNGIKGDAFKNLKVETASSAIQSYDGQTDDITKNRKVLVYDYYHYDNKQNGEPKKIYLGDYNMIENISMSDDGTITIDYSHNDNSVFNQKVKWITSVNLNTTNGKLTVNYNHGTAYTTDLDWINGVDVANDGTVTFSHTHNNDTVFSKKIKWCTGVTINNDGTVTFKWNNGTQDTVFDNIIQWIDVVDLANNGTLTVTYNIPDEEHPQEKKKQIFSNAIKWIDTINLNQNGTLTVTYNTSEQKKFQNAIKSISSITHAVAGEIGNEEGQLVINYNYGDSDKISMDILTDINLDSEGNLKARWNGNEGSGGKLSTIGSIAYVTDMKLDQDGILSFKWNNNQTWQSLGKVAPYANNTKMNISRILRGRHYTESATSTNVHLEFYLENVGYLRDGEIATITDGTATLYYNDGTQVGQPINLAGNTINGSTTSLTSVNLNLTLAKSDYPLNPSNNSLSQLVDIELNNVNLTISREPADAATINYKDLTDAISTNASNISINVSKIQALENIWNNNMIDRINKSEINPQFNVIRIRKIKQNNTTLFQQSLNGGAFFDNKIFASNNFDFITAEGLKIYYNNYFIKIQGDIKPIRQMGGQNVTTQYPFLTFNQTALKNLGITALPHNFRIGDTYWPITILTRSVSGRNFYYNNANKIIYFYDNNYSWGNSGSQTPNSESIRVDMIVLFDLTT